MLEIKRGCSGERKTKERERKGWPNATGKKKATLKNCIWHRRSMVVERET